MADLKERGLEEPLLFIDDGLKGLGQVVKEIYPMADFQSCILHKVRSSLSKVRKKHRDAVAEDMGRLDEITTMVARVKEEFEKIDILVNNAGTNPTVEHLIDIQERAWSSVMNLNLKGLVFLSQSVARVMREKGGGNIVNIASVEGIRPGILVIYSISKAGVIHATKVMAKEWAPYRNI